MKSEELLKIFRQGLVSRNEAILSAWRIRRAQEPGAVSPDVAARVEGLLHPLVARRLDSLPDVEEELVRCQIFLQCPNPDARDLLSGLVQWRDEMAALEGRLRELAESITAGRPAASIPESPARSFTCPDDFCPERARDLNMKILTAEVLLGFSKPSALPPHVQLEPTTYCNFKCRTCCARKSRQEFDIGMFRKLQPVLPFAHFIELLGLGEPTLGMRFGEICDYCRSFDCCLHVLTNGSTLAAVDALRRVTRIGISFDGDNKRTFEAIRRGSRFEGLLEAIKRFRIDNPQIFMYLSATINRANLDEVAGIAIRACELGMQAVCYHLMAPSMDYLRRLVLTRQDIPVYLAQLEAARQACASSCVRIFDYVCHGGLADEKEQRDKEALLRFIEGVPAHSCTLTSPLIESLGELEKLRFEPYPPALRTLFEGEVEAFAGAGESSRDSGPIEDGFLPSLASLEARLNELKNELGRQGLESLHVPHCLAPWTRLVIKADGRMFPCGHWSKAYGDLTEIPDFKSAWHNSFMASVREAFLTGNRLPPFCRECTRCERYQALPEFINAAHSLGIDYPSLRKPSGFSPPPGKLLE